MGPIGLMGISPVFELASTELNSPRFGRWEILAGQATERLQKDYGHMLVFSSILFSIFVANLAMRGSWSLHASGVNLAKSSKPSNFIHDESRD
jgi:hypothetical protein